MAINFRTRHCANAIKAISPYQLLPRIRIYCDQQQHIDKYPLAVRKYLRTMKITFRSVDSAWLPICQPTELDYAISFTHKRTCDATLSQRTTWARFLFPRNWETLHVACDIAKFQTVFDDSREKRWKSRNQLIMQKKLMERWIQGLLWVFF